MPVIKSAKKRLRASTRKRIVNLKTKKIVKTALKNFSAKPTQKTLDQVYSALDTAAKKGVTPKGRANRKKSRLSLLFSKTMRPKRRQTKTDINKREAKVLKRPSQK
jgi:small subunit ribosomal protein S20